MKKPPNDPTERPKRFRDLEMLGIKKVEQLEGPFPPEHKAFLSKSLEVPASNEQSAKSVGIRHAELSLAADANYAAHRVMNRRFARKAFLLSVGMSIAVMVGAMLAVASTIFNDANFAGFTLLFTAVMAIASCLTNQLKYAEAEREHWHALASWTDIRQDLCAVMSLPTVEMRDAAMQRLEGKAYLTMRSEAGQRISDSLIVEKEEAAAIARGIDVG